MGGGHDLNHQPTRIVGIRARTRTRTRTRARARILPLARVCRVRLISGCAAAGRHRDATGSFQAPVHFRQLVSREDAKPQRETQTVQWPRVMNRPLLFATFSGPHSIAGMPWPPAVCPPQSSSQSGGHPGTAVPGSPDGHLPQLGLSSPRSARKKHGIRISGTRLRLRQLNKHIHLLTNKNGISIRCDLVQHLQHPRIHSFGVVSRQ